MVNPLTRKPHIYKKGKILNLKPLDEGQDKPAKTYVFSSSTANMTMVQNHCNNINQVLGRTYLGLMKLLSYIGLSRDPSEKFSKEPSNFNKFKNLFFNKGENEDIKKKLEDLEPLIQKIHPRLQNIKDDVKKIRTLETEKPISRDEILDFTKRLNQIQDKLTAILGE